MFKVQGAQDTLGIHAPINKRLEYLPVKVCAQQIRCNQQQLIKLVTKPLISILIGQNIPDL